MTTGMRMSEAGGRRRCSTLLASMIFATLWLAWQPSVVQAQTPAPTP